MKKRNLKFYVHDWNVRLCTCITHDTFASAICVLHGHAPIITSWKGWVYHWSTVSNPICVILSLGNDTKSSSRPAICSARLGVPTALSTSVRSKCRNVAPMKKITRLSALLDHRLDMVYRTHINRFIKSTSRALQLYPIGLEIFLSNSSLCDLVMLV